MMGFGGMFLSWGLLIALLVGGVMLVSQRFTPRHLPVEHRQRTAQQVLAERLARGEITQEEYDAILTRIEP
jgi:uncharacterized membrane protein